MWCCIKLNVHLHVRILVSILNNLVSYHIDFFFLTREDGLRENVPELKGKNNSKANLRMVMQDVIVKYTISHTSIKLFIKVLHKFNNLSTKEKIQQ